ncbi:terpenoid synthase [Russula ochroleuca]|uniref:Terpene synthase n=1 Tax=Russula ochroleuca TaxID=152965 RepID=A0A9P5N106_9AGAM|nr:terpenoid synthase [Russula ochroleuca]
MSNRYYIPNNLENWKWPRHLNPHYPEAKAASAAWARSFGAFSPKAQYAYDRCDFNLLASLAYPLLSKERVRTGCDLMNMFFVYDEYSDVAHEDEVQVMANIIMDALRNPHTPRPKGEWVGGEVTRQFWELAIKTASPQSQKRFIETFATYTQAVVQQAADRTHEHVRSIQEYLEVRRDTIGAKPSFAILETGMNLPDEAVQHPVIQEMSILSIDMILLGNDIASYNLEQARGDDNHNIITIVMHHNKTDIQGAMDWVYDYHKELEAKFMDLYENKIPKFGEPVDTELAQYVDGLGNWVRASDQWGFESERYFGKKAPEIQKTRWVTLLPKERSDELGPQLVDGSML